MVLNLELLPLDPVDHVPLQQLLFADAHANLLPQEVVDGHEGVRDEGQDEPVEPYLIPDVHIPVIGEVIVICQILCVAYHAGIAGENFNDSLEGEAKYVGLQQKSDEDRGADVGDHEVGHDVGGGLRVVLVALELGDGDHDELEDLLKYHNEEGNAHRDCNLLIIDRNVVVAELILLSGGSIHIKAPRLHDRERTLIFYLLVSVARVGGVGGRRGSHDIQQRNCDEGSADQGDQ